MKEAILGLHHVTAIASDAKKNHAFYTRILGLRLVKKTVNFDDPNTYHLYYGNTIGSPGTILTFFPWQNIAMGRRGPKQVTEVGYSVPEDSLEFWLKRFEEYHVTYNKISEKFGERYLTFLDPDGLKLELTVSKTADSRLPWELTDVPIDFALRGFHHVTITTQDRQPTAEVLTDIFGYTLSESHVNRFRFKTDAVEQAHLVDIVEAKGEQAGQIAGGSVHHVAFRVQDENTLMRYRQKLIDAGLQVTEKIDRNYFYSLYFREPGGVLFELATDNPGFTVDEPVDALGRSLKLPSQYESHRDRIMAQLPPIDG